MTAHRRRNMAVSVIGLGYVGLPLACLCAEKEYTTYGIDKSNNTSYATSYSGRYISPYYRVGTYLNQRQFKQMEITFAKELAANEGVKVEYRINLTDSFTTIGTYTEADLGAITTHFVNQLNIPKTEFIQLKVSLTGTTTTNELKSLILR